MAAALRLGLTGGIGSGKSTVGAQLEAMGAVLIDADLLARATTAPGGSAMAQIEDAFGPGLLTPEGALDREKMRQQAFAEPSVRVRLEAIVHPLVGLAMERAAAQAESAGARCLVFDVPLLVESAHWRKRLDRVLVVDCSTETQTARVMRRNGLSRTEVEHILEAQASRARRLRAADAVVFNDGVRLEELALQVQEIGQQFGL